jgi:hypothetical protein
MIMDPEILTDTVLEWFQTLDYEYMVLHIIVCYGLYYSKNMGWIVQWFSPVRKKGVSKAVWVIGGFLALMEMVRFIPFIGEEAGGLSVQKFISIFHSYIVIQVFVDPIVQTVHKWMSVFRKTTSGLTDQKD